MHLDGHLVATTMRTPGHDFELAVGPRARRRSARRCAGPHLPLLRHRERRGERLQRRERRHRRRGARSDPAPQREHLRVRDVRLDRHRGDAGDRDRTAAGRERPGPSSSSPTCPAACTRTRTCSPPPARCTRPPPSTARARRWWCGRTSDATTPSTRSSVGCCSTVSSPATTSVSTSVAGPASRSCRRHGRRASAPSWR